MREKSLPSSPEYLCHNRFGCPIHFAPSAKWVGSRALPQLAESYEGLGRTRTESGTLLLQKPGLMRWDYSRPAGKLFLLDGKYAWFYSKGDPQVQRIEAKKLDDLRSPLRFLLGHTQLEKEVDHLTASPAADGKFALTGVPHK